MSESSIRYAVSLEACHILNAERADEIAALIRDRMSDIDEDVYVCISQYEQVQNRVTPRGVADPRSDVAMPLICNQKGCSKLAAHRFTWPGEDEAGICEMHVGGLYATVAAMGMRLEIKPISRVRPLSEAGA